MELQRRLLIVLILLALILDRIQCAHFRGGSINWRSEGGTKVHFYFRLGWTYGNGPGCQPHLIGQLVTAMSTSFWTCQSNNCNSIINMHNVNYYCTGANRAENWEQGRNDFTHTFPGTGPFTIGFKGGAWINLSNGKGGSTWNIKTTVDLRLRSDTASPNSSPESQSKPIYYVQYNCEIRLKLPIVDADGDNIRCRWSQGNECESVCNALPNAYLDEEECTLFFNSTSANRYRTKGVYAVAVTVEDYPKIPMTLGGSTKLTPSDALSSVPLQFLVSTIPPTGPCDAGPRFICPTPEEKKVLTVEEGDTITVDLFADNGNDTGSKANRISASGPVALTLSAVVQVVNSTDTFTATLSWTPTHNDIGNNIVCANVENDKGKSGDQRCFVINVVPKGCQSLPCQNGGKCVANMGNYSCVCRPGFLGHDCDIDIDECFSNPCPSGTFCVDEINAYTCPNITTTVTPTSATTTERNYTGMCPLEYEHCVCTFRLNKKSGHRLGFSRQDRDVLGLFFGFPIGLVLSVFTFDRVFKPCKKNRFKKEEPNQSKQEKDINCKE